MFRKILVVIISLVIIIGLIFGGKILLNYFSPAAKTVGCLDQEAIFNLPDFEKANQEFEKAIQDTRSLFQKESAKLSKEERVVLSIKLQRQLDQKKADLFNPLFQRAEFAVAHVAARRKISVVLDKNISIYGITDITDEVIKLFQKKKKLSLPKTEVVASSPIGYFDQEVIRSLRPFQKIDKKFYKIAQELQKEFITATKNIPESKKRKLYEEHNAKLIQKQSELYGLLYQQVTKAIEQVAKANKLSLVLDKPQILYGGKNITDEVVTTFMENYK